MITNMDTAWLWAGSFGAPGGRSVYYTVFTAGPGFNGREVVATISLSLLEGPSAQGFAEIDSYTPPFGPPVVLENFQNAIHANQAIAVTFRLAVAEGLADAQASLFYFN